MIDHNDERKKENTRIRLIVLLLVLLVMSVIIVLMVFFRNKNTGYQAIDPGEYESRLAETYERTTEAEICIPEKIVIEETEPAPVYKEEITLTFAGDILFDPNYAIMNAMLGRSEDKKTPDITSAIDEELISIMIESDVFMVNNEFPYSDRGAPKAGKKYTFRARPEYVSLLNDIGTDIVALANNHVNDYGLDAMLDTFETLKAAEIPYVGAGNNLDEASAPYYTDVEGMKIAFVSATQIERTVNPDTVGATETSPGVFRCLDDELLLEKIREAKENADFVIVYIHWGTESTDRTDWLQDEQAPKIAEAGADLIIGDHPHVLQKIDYIGDTPIIYSLGNFLFNSKTQYTCLFQVTLDTKEKTIKSIRFIPGIQSGCRTRIADEKEWIEIIDYMQSISAGVEIDYEGIITK